MCNTCHDYIHVADLVMKDMWTFYEHISMFEDITPHPSVPPPDQPVIKDTTSDMIILSWSLGPYIDYSVVMWQIEDSGGRPTTEADEGVSEKIDAPDNTYTIRGLQSNAVYHITVTVFNILGNKTSLHITFSNEM